MVKTKIQLFLLLWMLAASVMAQEGVCIMTLKLTDGKKMQFLMSESDNADVFCSKGIMTIFYGEYSEQLGRSSVSFERDQVDDLTFDTADGIEDISNYQGRISFNLINRNKIQVRGLKADDHLNVYAVDGKNIQVPVVKQADMETIDLSSTSRGIYVISINNSFTFKILIP